MTQRQVAPSMMGIREFMWQAIKPYRWWLLLMFQATFISSSYIFINNYAMKLVVDAFSEAHTAYGDLVYPIALFVMAQIVLDVSWQLSNFAAWHTEPFVHKNILLKSYDYIQHHSYSYFQNHPSGTIISKLKGILDGYDHIFANLHFKIGKSFLTVVISIFSLLLVNRSVFLFILIWSIVLVLVMYPMSLKLNRLSSILTESKHHVMGLFSDNITNIFSLFQFAKRKAELERTKRYLSHNYTPHFVKMLKHYFKLSMIGSVLYWFMLISVFLFMIWLRQEALITTGDFVFVMMMTVTIAFELWAFTCSMFDFMKEIGDLKSSCSILTIPHQHVDKPSAKPHTIITPNIQFNDVSFYYDNGNSIFEDLNLEIPAGQKIGIVGHSGAGKSTLIGLLLKNFSPTMGHICVDYQAIDEMTSDSLRSQIALIPQDIMLFHRTIAENIGYAKASPTMEEIKFAAKMANIDDYIESLPEKYETVVGERGVKLSGGQRQRIAIARAILKSAQIIILDEATSSLDTVTEQEIQHSINQLLDQTNTTVIAIAHRLSTIRHMDRILVMEGGVIIQDGTFDELLANENGYFKTLWDNQVNGMVL